MLLLLANACSDTCALDDTHQRERQRASKNVGMHFLCVLLVLRVTAYSRSCASGMHNHVLKTH